MMNKAINIKEFKKKLAYNISIVAIVFGSTFGTLNSAYAGDGTDASGEVVTDAAITATDATGLLIDEDGDGAIAISIDPDGGITLGAAGGVDAITSDSSGAAATTFTITDSDTASIDLLTIAGDIDIGDADNDDTMILNSTNANLYIGNNIAVGAATNTVAITAGSGGDVTITVDNDAAEAQSIAATITGSTNTVTLNVIDSGGNAGHTTFTKAISVTNLNINPTDDQTAEVTFDAAVTATTITIGDSTDAADDDVTVHFEAQAADYTVAGTIDNAVAADETAIHVLDTTANTAPDTITFSGNIGSTIAIDAITVGSATTGGDAIFSGDVSATVFSVLGGNHGDEDNKADMDGDLTAAVTLNDATGTATLTFTGAAAQTMTGAITAADGEGILSTANTAGKVTFGAIGADDAKLLSVTIAASNEAVFGGAVAADTLTIAGSATVQVVDNESGTIAMGASSILYIDDTLTNGLNVFNAVAAVRPIMTSGAKIYLPGNLKTTQTLVLFLGEADNGFADNATTVTETTAAIQDNALFDYTAAASTSGNGSTVVTATYKSDTTAATELGITSDKAKALKQALLAAISDTNADATLEDQFTNALNGIAGQGATADTALANQVGVQTDGIVGSTLATRAMTGSVQGIISNRMASLRSGDAYVTGVAAGNGMSTNSGFLQVFGSNITQNNTTVASGTEYGYDADTRGLALGFDGISQSGSVIGLSLSRSNTNVTGKGTGNSKNDIESLTASIYADKVTDNGYLEGSLTFGRNDNATSRIVNTAGIDRTYKGAYDSEQVSLKIGGGVGDSIIFFGNITGTVIQTDSYTETSSTASDNLRLKIAQDDITSIVGSLGFKGYKANNNNGTSMISLAINNEFGDNTINSTNTYQGGGSAFKTSTGVEELSATLGLGFSIDSDTGSVNLGFEVEANQNEYLSHYGTIKLVRKF